MRKFLHCTGKDVITQNALARQEIVIVCLIGGHIL